MIERKIESIIKVQDTRQEYCNHLDMCKNAKWFVGEKKVSRKRPFLRVLVLLPGVLWGGPVVPFHFPLRIWAGLHRFSLSHIAWVILDIGYKLWESMPEVFTAITSNLIYSHLKEALWDVSVERSKLWVCCFWPKSGHPPLVNWRVPWVPGSSL